MSVLLTPEQKETFCPMVGKCSDKLQSSEAKDLLARMEDPESEVTAKEVEQLVRKLMAERKRPLVDASFFDKKVRAEK